jgi:3'-5' exoribonuclease 1
MGSANIPAVLEKLGLGGFQGREHSGIDDVRNIARILQELVRYERGWRVTANARIKGKERSWDWMKKTGEVDWPHPPGE